MAALTPTQKTHQLHGYAHWQLAGRCFRSTTWHWLFNHVTAPTFTRQELEEPLARYARGLDPKHRLSASTISRDLEDLHPQLRTTGFAGGSPEDFAEPLLGELGLLYKRSTRVSTRSAAALRHLCMTESSPMLSIDFWNRTANGPKLAGFRDYCLR
ncbi:MAG: DUF4007 family protein [Burkholderiaceae bacterium]